MNLLGFGKPKIKSSTVVGLTESGKREAEKYTSRGDDFAILASLDEKSPQSMGQLAEETHLSFGDVVQRIKRLSQQGYVRIVGERD